MRYLGIDFGHRKMGLALSDEQGNFAYPHSVLVNDNQSVKKIAELCKAEGVIKIVIGDTRDLKGGANKVTEAAHLFAEELQKETNLSVAWQTEVFTSREAERIIGDDDKRDARAASIMLSSYLDQQKNKRV